jgi:hypothetical protein
MSPNFRHLQKMISEIDDREIRARMRREYGLVGLDSDGRPGLMPGDGAGPEATLNGAVTGDNWDEFYGGNPELIAAERADRADAERAMLYLSKDDVREIYDAASFAVQARQHLLNSQITIVYRLLGIENHNDATRLLSDYLRELRMRLKDWGVPFDFVYVHEHSQERGFHTHLVTVLPVHLRQSVIRWSAKFFVRRCAGISPADAVKVQISGVRSPAHQLALHQHRLQYICKGLDPKIMERGEDGRRQPLIELLGIPEKFRRQAGSIESLRRCGASHSISAGQRAMAPAPLSAFGDRAWSWLYRGWELNEFQDRIKEEGLREVVSIAKSEIGAPATDYSNEDPRKRSRSWVGWWVGKQNI